MLKFDVKKYIENEVMLKAENYGKDNGFSHLFSSPLIGYASADNPLFMAFFEKGWSKHPKEIYRPCKTVVVHFLPFAEGLSPVEISKAKDASILFAAILNDTIKESLEKLGRLASLSSLPGDWDNERDDFSWSHKLAAYVAGMGTFGLASSFNTEKGSMGRFDSVLTEMEIEPSHIWHELEEVTIKNILQDIVDAQKFGPADILSKNLMPIDSSVRNSCPAGAIGEYHIDKQKCRDYCRSLDNIAPASDVCGLCFDPHSI